MSLREHLEHVDEMPLANAYLNLRYGNVSIDGLEHLPESGASLAVSNHEHIDDSFLYYRMFREELGRMPRFAVTADVFKWPGPHGALAREFLLSRGQIPVDRFSVRSAIELRAAMGAAMQQGELGMIFPEKTTPKTGYVHRFHTAAAQIALDNEVPITRMHIRYEKPAGSLRRDVAITIAPPLLPEEFAGMSRVELSARLQQDVGRLGKQALSPDWAVDPTGYFREFHADRFTPEP